MAAMKGIQIGLRATAFQQGDPLCSSIILKPFAILRDKHSFRSKWTSSALFSFDVLTQSNGTCVTQILSEKCPLCGDDAVFYFVDYEDRKYFNCPHCTKFQITRRAQSKLAEALKHWREQMSEWAQHTPAENLLVISLSPATMDRGRTTETFTHKYLPKSGLPCEPLTARSKWTSHRR